MAAKVYGVPEGIQVPEFNFEDYSAYEKEEEKFIQKLRDFCIKRKQEKNVGEIIRFPMGDGYAQYMVASMNPVELIHIPTGDAWDSSYADLMTAEEIQKKLDGEKALKDLFK